MTERFDYGKDTRPHVLGWGEDLPYLHELDSCTLCGRIGHHDIIQLGRQETLDIVHRVKPTVAVKLQS